jgi:hypothetical protein
MASVSGCSELAEDDGQDGEPGLTNEGSKAVPTERGVPRGVRGVGLSLD